jgi:hypothetical protein
MSKINVGDTVTINDETPNEYTVLAINPDPDSGWEGGFAWVHGEACYETKAVKALTKVEPYKYVVEFHYKGELQVTRKFKKWYEAMDFVKHSAPGDTIVIKEC